MVESPQTIRVSRAGAAHDATIGWTWTIEGWTVTLESSVLGPHEARADDAFEALCLLRERLEPQGWRIGVAGAQRDVWPSGMARDQGGGLRAYRLATAGVGDLVDTFEPVDPASVATVAEQQAEAERVLGGPVRAPRRDEQRGSRAVRVRVERLDAHPGDLHGREVEEDVPADLMLSDLVARVLEPFLDRAPRARWRCRARVDGRWRDMAEIVTTGPSEARATRLLVDDEPLGTVLAPGQSTFELACRPV